MWTLLLAAACTDAPERRRQIPPPGPDYAVLVAGIDERRRADDADLDAFNGAVVDLIDAWKGTPWDFWGTAREPGDDPIACGHFVAGVLDDAGLEVERQLLGQQAAEHIIQTVTSEASIRRYSRAGVTTVVAGVEADGPGVYVVGLDHHVGFLLDVGRGVRFCHSSWRDGVGVICEDALDSPSLPSRYTVVGKLDEVALIDAWRSGTHLATVTGR